MADEENTMNTPQTLDEQEQEEAANRMSADKNQSFADGPDFGEQTNSLNNKADLGHGDLVLTPEEQKRKEIETEKKRQKKNNSADNLNSNIEGINAVKGLWNRKKVKKINQELQVLEKNKIEKNDNLKKILRKKKIEQRSLRNKLTGQIIRIFPELISGIGIPLAIWEVIKLANKNTELKRLKKDMKKIVLHMSNNEKEFKNKQEKMETEIYNLQNVFKREGPGDFQKEPVK